MCNVTVYLEERFVSFKGEYYSLVYDDNFWQRYFQVFDSVNVVARVLEVDNFNDIHESYNKITDSRINFIKIPYFHGLKQGILNLPKLNLAIYKAVKNSDKNILRLPGLISIFAGICITFDKKKYAVELIGDPYDVLSSGVGGKAAPMLKVIFTKLTQIITRNANAVSYVTKQKMQVRYPAQANAYTTYYSSLNLNIKKIEKNIRQRLDVNNLKILMVGSMEQKYKGFDIALKAISLLSFKENIEIHLVGDGVIKQDLENLAFNLGLSDNVFFYGRVPNEKVLSLMKSTDLFLIPSRTEGLPRVLIEAMAMGLPVIGSNVGGIPELIDQEFVFENENVDELVKLIEYITKSKNIATISKANIEKVQEYDKSILDKRRLDFYSFLNNLR